MPHGLNKCIDEMKEVRNFILKCIAMKTDKCLLLFFASLEINDQILS